jgi:hypothetical protein
MLETKQTNLETIVKSSSNKLAKEVENSISTFKFKLVNMIKCNASNNNH